MCVQQFRKPIPCQQRLIFCHPQCSRSVCCVGTVRNCLGRIVVVADRRTVCAGSSQRETLVHPICWISLGRPRRLLSLQQLVSESCNLFDHGSVPQQPVPVGVQLIPARI